MEKQLFNSICNFKGGMGDLSVTIKLDCNDRIEFMHGCGANMELKVNKKTKQRGDSKWIKHWFNLQCPHCDTSWTRWRKHQGPNLFNKYPKRAQETGVLVKDMLDIEEKLKLIGDLEEIDVHMAKQEEIWIKEDASPKEEAQQITSKASQNISLMQRFLIGFSLWLHKHGSDTIGTKFKQEFKARVCSDDISGSQFQEAFWIRSAEIYEMYENWGADKGTLVSLSTFSRTIRGLFENGHRKIIRHNDYCGKACLPICVEEWVQNARKWEMNDTDDMIELQNLTPVLKRLSTLSENLSLPSSKKCVSVKNKMRKSTKTRRQLREQSNPYKKVRSALNHQSQTEEPEQN